jgi:hypothetical protein
MKATKEMIEMTINKRTQEVSNLAWEFPKNKGEKFEYETIKEIAILMTVKLLELTQLLRAYESESKQ